MMGMPLPLAASADSHQHSLDTRAFAPAPRPFALPAALRLWHLASLDAPTVAVVWSLAFAWAAHVVLPVWVPCLLALGTWTVYIGDRLLDARKAIRLHDLQALHERHFFHWRHRFALIPLAIASAAAAAWLIFSRMPIGFRERNAVLAAAAVVYFSGVHLPARPRFLRPLLSKELLVGVLFTAGCALPTLSRLHAPFKSAAYLTLAVVVLAFAATAWLNCYAIDRWESCTARSGVFTPAMIFAASGLVLSMVPSFDQSRSAALLASIAASALLLALLDRSRNRFSPLALRACADLALLTPLALLLR